jgi:hypothetical protein
MSPIYEDMSLPRCHHKLLDMYDPLSERATRSQSVPDFPGAEIVTGAEIAAVQKLRWVNAA